MLKALFYGMMGAAFLGSLFWWSARDCVVPMLAVWTAAIGVLIYSNLADRFLWIPVLLALAGVFGSFLALVVPVSITLVANLATLVLFSVSLEVLKGKQRRHLPLRNSTSREGLVIYLHKTDVHRTGMLKVLAPKSNAS